MESNEITFLKQFFKFQIEKGKSFEEFETIARATLVETGQIDEKVFAKFLKNSKLDQEIAKKEFAIKALKSQIKELEKEIVTLKKSQSMISISGVNMFTRGVGSDVERDACGHPISRSNRDGCGYSSSTLRSSC